MASPVGINKQIVEHGVNGYLAQSTDEWLDALRKLLADRELRTEFRRKGRAKVEKEYSLQVMAPRLVSLLRSVMAQNI